MEANICMYVMYLTCSIGYCEEIMIERIPHGSGDGTVFHAFIRKLPKRKK